jgi:ribonuclease BN (tRNA processing enzyme)
MAVMRLTVLGSGTCVPSIERNAPGYLLEAGGRNALVDCGSGTLLQLARAGRTCMDLDEVFLTHLHPDHISDLLPLVHALTATPGMMREKTLHVVGPKGTGEYYECCVLSVLSRPETFSLEVFEMQDRYSAGLLDVLASRTVHSGNSVAFRFECGGRSLVMTGDCDYDDELVRLARGADLLVIDCSFPEGMKAPGHLTPRLCGLVADRAGVGRLVLSHIYPSPLRDSDLIAQCRDGYGGEITVARDLMEMDV